MNTGGYVTIHHDQSSNQENFAPYVFPRPLAVRSVITPPERPLAAVPPWRGDTTHKPGAAKFSPPLIIFCPQASLSIGDWSINAKAL